jgi:peptidoglycan/LPS O-acetylase OafA/YrhL
MIPSINGLRAVAIIFVLLSHFVHTRTVPAFLKNILSPIAEGDLGVRLFFVISGYLITTLLLRERKKYGQINMKKFYIRRSLRIFPVFYGYICFVAISAKWTGIPIESEVIYSSALYIQNFAPWGSDWRLAHSWSLAVEEQFYLIWPAIFYKGVNILKKSTLLVLLLLGVVARSISYKYPEMSNYLLLPFIRNIDFLAGGCTLAYLTFYHNSLTKEITSKISQSLILIGLTIVVILHKLEGHPDLDMLIIPICGTISVLFFAVLIAWTTQEAHKNKTLVRVLNSRIMDKIGIYSYGLYVWQQYYFVPAYHPSADRFWTQFPSNVILLIVSVTFSYHLIEKPFLKWKSRFST